MDEINNLSELSGKDNIEKTVKINYKTQGLEEFIKILIEAGKEQEELNKEAERGKKAWENLKETATELVDLGKTVANIFKNQLLTNVNALNDSMESFAGVTFSSMLSFSNQLSTISNYTKELINTQISWEQELFTTYKGIAEASKGSTELYDTFVRSRDVLSDNVKQWIRLGGETVGVQLAANYVGDTVAGIDQISESLLFKWREQNMNLGIADEQSAKIAANQNRVGMSLKDSVKFQKDVYKQIKVQFKSNALTSKVMEKISESNWAILNYSKGNVKETARIAANAHAWGVSIDEIYATAHKLSKAEESIEMSRKAQLMFGIKLNARQMQYLAQTGKEADLTEYLVKTFRTQVGDFDQLTLSQKQYIADSIASGDILKARNMLLGDEEKQKIKTKTVEEEQRDIQKESNEILKAQTNDLAVYYKQLNEVKAAGWEMWGKTIGWVFGEQLSATQASMRMEQIRVGAMNSMFLPMLKKINSELFSQYGITSLIGAGIGDHNSLLGQTFIALKPLSEFMGEIGFTIAEWWVKNLGEVKRIFEGFSGQGAAFGEIFTGVGDAVLEFLSDTELVKDTISAIKTLFWGVGVVLGFIIRNFKKILIFAIAYKGIGLIINTIARARWLWGQRENAMKAAIWLWDRRIWMQEKARWAWEKVKAAWDKKNLVIDATKAVLKAVGNAASVPVPGLGFILAGIAGAAIGGLVGYWLGKSGGGADSGPNVDTSSVISDASSEWASIEAGADESSDLSSIEASAGEQDFSSLGTQDMGLDDMGMGMESNPQKAKEDRQELATLIGEAIAKVLLKSAKDIEGPQNKNTQKFVPVLIGGSN